MIIPGHSVAVKLFIKVANLVIGRGSWGIAIVVETLKLHYIVI